MTRGDDMHPIIEGELAEQAEGNDAAIAAGYLELRELLNTMPQAFADRMTSKYGRTGRKYSKAADRAADLAYDLRVDADDLVLLDVPDELADLRELSADEGHPLRGYALDVALAVLAYDELAPADWSLITQPWVEAGAPLPALARAESAPAAPAAPATRRPAPATRRPAPAPAPAPRARPAAPRAPFMGGFPPPPPPGAEPDRTDELVHLAMLERAERARRAKLMRRSASALWWIQAPVFMGASMLAGWFVSWVPLAVGFLVMIVIGTFAVTTRAKADRV